MGHKRVLVVEDDPRVQHLLRSQLAARGFAVTVASTGEAALDLLGHAEPGVVLLDINLPGMDGLETCRQIRRWSQVPILLLTAKDDTDTKIAALEGGADDYLTKPFHMGELVARMRALMRRCEGAGGDAAPSSVLVRGDLTIELEKREVRRGQETVALTRTEFDLLWELAIHPDRVLTYEQLLERVWGSGSGDIRSIYVHLSNLRRKLGQGMGARYIHAVPGVGYRFRIPT